MQVMVTVLSMLLGMAILTINSKSFTMVGVVILLIVIMYFCFTIKALRDRVVTTEKLLNKFENLSTTLLNTFYKKYEGAIRLNSSLKKLLENTIDENRKLAQYYEDYLKLQSRIDILLSNIKKIQILLSEYIKSHNTSINSEIKISKIANAIQKILEAELQTLDSKYTEILRRLHKINNNNYQPYLDAIKLKTKEANVDVSSELKELELCFTKRKENVQLLLNDLTEMKNEIVKIVTTISNNENLLEILDVVNQLHQIIMKLSEDCNNIITLIEETLTNKDDDIISVEVIDDKSKKESETCENTKNLTVEQK